MHTELYNDGRHKCIGFYDLDEDIQSNQFLVIDGDHGVLFESGGNLAHKEFLMCARQYLKTTNIDYVIGSHLDPDIFSSAKKWLVSTDCKILVPRIWERFIVHYTAQFNNRIIVIPDNGMDIRIGKALLKAIPAHFLRSEGNFQFYDPISKILFSGDMGASLFLQYSEKPNQPVKNFDSHIRNMESFHRRYMSNNKICRYWVNMVRDLDIEWIIPQHGRPFKGKNMIERFLRWVEELECGTDLVTQELYQIP